MLNYLRAIYYFFFLLFGLSALAPHLTPYSGIADQISFFHQYTLIGLVTLIVISILVQSRIRLVICLMFFIVALVPTVRLIPLTSKNETAALARFASNDNSNIAKILSFNVEIGSVRAHEIISKISTEQPDIVVLQEVIESVNDELGSAKDYPYRASDSLNFSSGIEVLSKWPINSVTAVKVGEGAPNSRLKNFAVRVDFTTPASAISDVPNWAKDAVIYAIHAPTPRHAGGWAKRNIYLEKLGTHIAREQKHIIIVAGDSNTAPWSWHYFKFLSKTGLKNSQNPFVPSTTRYLKEFSTPEWFGSPVDHILTNENLKAGETITGPSLGSDHRPIMLEIMNN